MVLQMKECSTLVFYRLELEVGTSAWMYNSNRYRNLFRELLALFRQVWNVEMLFKGAS